jgi:hypothetical protein
MYDMKYNNELDKYARTHKLYISNELKSVDPEYTFENTKQVKSFLTKHAVTVVNHVIVKWKDITIVDIQTKGVIEDDELLKLIKREINLIELGV